MTITEKLTLLARIEAANEQRIADWQRATTNSEQH